MSTDPCDGVCLVCFGEDLERICRLASGHDGDCDDLGIPESDFRAHPEDARDGYEFEGIE